MKTKRIFFSFLKTRRTGAQLGMALPFSLIMLLVAGVLVGVSLYIIENFTKVSLMKNEDELLANAAIAGIEDGKKWLEEEYDGTGKFPKRNVPSVSQAELSLPVITPLVAKSYLEEGILSDDLDGVRYESIVYHIDGVGLAGLTFVTGAPPIPRGPGGDPGYITEGSATSTVEYGYYLIRSRATLNEKEKVVEQFLQLGF